MKARGHGCVRCSDYQRLAEAAHKLANPPFGVSWDTGLLPRIKAVNDALKGAQSAPPGYRLQPIAEFDAYREVLAKMDALERRNASLQRDAARWQWVRTRIDTDSLREMAFDYPPDARPTAKQENSARSAERIIDRRLRSAPKDCGAPDAASD